MLRGRDHVEGTCSGAVPRCRREAGTTPDMERPRGHHATRLDRIPGPALEPPWILHGADEPACPSRPTIRAAPGALGVAGFLRIVCVLQLQILALLLCLWAGVGLSWSEFGLECLNSLALEGVCPPTILYIRLRAHNVPPFSPRLQAIFCLLPYIYCGKSVCSLPPLRY
jgi:hypothetical protein